jgi:hypothetical protein
MTTCECGCEELTKGGDFLPGHDQKLRASLEERTGGILKLRDLVELSEDFVSQRIALEDFGEMVQDLFDR